MPAKFLRRYVPTPPKGNLPIGNIGGFDQASGQPDGQLQILRKSSRDTGNLARFSHPVSILATVALLVLGCAAGTADSAEERPLGSESKASLTAYGDDVSEFGFVEITAGDDHTCALRRSGEIVCWGRDDSGQASPYFGAFRSVVAGGDQTCGLRPSGEAQCWGYDMAKSPLSGTFTAVSTRNNGSLWWACGLRRTGMAECWSGAGETSWNDRRDPQPFNTMPSGAFAEIAVGWQQVCGLRPSGIAVCWPSHRSERVPPPAGELTGISAGGYYTCGLRPSGAAACWNSGLGIAQVAPPSPPSGKFTTIAAGRTHTCGLRYGGEAICWGSDESGQASPPAGEFTTIAAGGSHTCGLRPDGEAICWGSDEYGQASAPL